MLSSSTIPNSSSIRSFIKSVSQRPRLQSNLRRNRSSWNKTVGAPFQIHLIGGINKDEDSSTQQQCHDAALLLPKIHVVAHQGYQLQTRRFLSTTSSQSAGSSSSDSSATSNSSHDNHPEDFSDERNSATWRKRASQQATDMREQASQRATDLRENARESIQEFREDPGEKMKSGAKSFSGMMQKYGPIFLGVHISIYFVTLGGIFAGINSGLMDPAYLMSMTGSGTDAAVETKDTVAFVVDWMKDHSWSKGMASFIERNPHFASLAVAWIISKFTEPLRLPISFVLTPRVARYLGKQPTEEDGEELAKPTSEATISTPSETSKESSTMK